MKEARTREIQSSSHRCGVERRLEQIWVFKMELLIRCAAGVWDRSSSLPGETTPSICSDTIALKHTGKENTHQAQKQSRSISKSWHSWHSLKNDLSLSFHYHTKFSFFFFPKYSPIGETRRGVTWALYCLLTESHMSLSISIYLSISHRARRAVPCDETLERLFNDYSWELWF